MEKRIEFIHEEIVKNLHHQWMIKNIAESVGLSVRHLQKLHKSETGISLMNWICNKRLEKAAELLADTFLTVKEVGYQVGMLNDSHFTRDFKKKYGLPPSIYRRQQGNKKEILSRQE